MVGVRRALINRSWGNCINRSAKPPQSCVVWASISSNRVGIRRRFGLLQRSSHWAQALEFKSSSRRSTVNQRPGTVARFESFEAMFKLAWRWSD